MSIPKYVLITDYIGGNECISEETIVLITSATKDNSDLKSQEKEMKKVL